MEKGMLQRSTGIQLTADFNQAIGTLFTTFDKRNVTIILIVLINKKIYLKLL